MAGKQEIAFDLKIAGVEQSIKSVKDLKSAIKSLQDEAEGADIGSEQYKNAIENIEKLNEKLQEVTRTEKQAAKATEDLANAEKEAAKETGDLRKQFEVLEDELFMLAGQGKQNSAEFKKLTIEAANLNKKIDDVNQSLSGGGAERAEGGFSKLSDSLGKLDFKGVAQGAKMMGTALAATGVMLIVKMVAYLIENFDELSKGSGGLAKALSFVGDIIGKIISMGNDLLNFVTDFIGLTSESERALEKQGKAIVDASKKSKAALEEQVKGFDNQIAAAKAAGKSTVALEKEKQDAIIATNNKLQEQLIAFVRGGGQLNEDQKKLFTESVAAEKAAVQEKKIITITANKEASDKAKENAKETAAANLAAIKTIEDAEIAAIKDEELRAFATEVKANERRLKEIAAGKESKELKRQEEEAQAILFENNLAKINADGAAKRKAEDEKAAAEKKAADEKAAAEKAAADAKILADKNTENTAAAELKVLQQGNDLQDLIDQLAVKRDIEKQNKELTASQLLLIDEKYNQDVIKLNKDAENKKREDAFKIAQMGFEAAQQLTDLFFMFKKNKAEKGSKEELELAKKQFNVQKAFNLTKVAMDGYMAISNIIATTPKADFGVMTGVLIASSAISTAVNLAKIAATKFDGGGASASGGGGGGAAPMPSIPAPPTIATSSNNTNQSTTFDESGKNLNQTQPQINVTATVGVDEIAKKSNRVEVLEQQSTF